MWRSGKLEITDKYEDIHSFVEANLIDRIGDAGKKLHTGRSRNDQVALDMKLYTRDEIASDRSVVKDAFTNDSGNHAGEYGDDYAWIYTPAESTADHTCASYGRIF